MSSPPTKPRRQLAGLSIDDIAIGSSTRKAVVRTVDDSDEAWANKQAAQHARDMITSVMSDEATVQGTDLGRVTSLRFSGLPFCGLRWFIMLPQSTREYKPADFGFRFFTSVGTAVHTVIQNAVHASKHYHALNDYICEDCKHRHVLNLIPVTKCKKCGSSKVHSDEHEVLWRGAVGHVDEILVPDLRKKKRVYLLDYKTTSMRGLEKENPVGYVHQIRSYGVALRDEEYEVVGCGLVYIPRDNPFKFKLSEIPFGDSEYSLQKKLLGRWVTDHAVAADVSTLRSALELLDSRPCRNKLKSFHCECPHKDFCAGNGDARPERMEVLVRTSYKEMKPWLPIANLKGLKKLPSL